MRISPPVLLTPSSKNALFKVIKITSASDLGKHVVVQGGYLLQ